MNRFLNRRDKDISLSRKEKYRDKKILPLYADSLWRFFKTSSHKKHDQEHASVVAEIKQKVLDAGHLSPEDDQVNFALGSDYANGDPERAFEILVLFQESVEGLIRPCDPNVKLVGAINRNNVTCYIDSVLFAMLGVFQSYDLIFCGTLENDAQRILSRMLLLYANMLRAGKLIHVDLTKSLQDALAACGWDHSPNDQQDASEFYGFIAQTLNIPLLSMKSNIFHHATPDENHDHRIVEEQVLNVSIPDIEDGQKVPLERCLEGFLNNKVEITRSLPQTDIFSPLRLDHDRSLLRRCNTSNSTPTIAISSQSTSSLMPNKLVRSLTLDDGRMESFFHTTTKTITTTKTHKKSYSFQESSSCKDVRILAWQFLNILRPSPINFSHSSNNLCNSVPILIGDIAWYKKNTASAKAIERDADTGKSAPALAICLKRYGFKNGHPFRKDTPIDIPEEMLLPHLIDDENEEDYNQAQKFKLVLMAVVCHRGKSLNEGHYTSLVRRAGSIADGDSNSAQKLHNTSLPPHYSEDQWYKFDDLANPRVYPVNFEEAVLDEMPYLLFYQIQPQFHYNYVPSDSTNSDPEPPSYDSSVALTVTISNHSEENDTSNTSFPDTITSTSRIPESRESGEALCPRPILKVSINCIDQQSKIQGSKPSYPVTSGSITSSNCDESAKARISRAASKFTKNGLRSRASSQSGESRISATISRLNIIKSKEQLKKVEVGKESQGMDTPAETITQSFNTEDNNTSPIEDNSDLSRIIRKKKRRNSWAKCVRKDPETQLIDFLEEKIKLKDPDKECKIM